MTPLKKKSTTAPLQTAHHDHHPLFIARSLVSPVLCQTLLPSAAVLPPQTLVEDVLKTISMMILLGRFHLVRVVLALIFVILFVTIYTNWHDNSVIHLK